MIALLQRVSQASVTVEGDIVGRIDRGLCVLVGVQPHDDEANSQKLVDKLLGYRVFTDDHGKMNLSVIQAGGQVLLVPQFTLAADTSQGRRPGFSTAAAPELAEKLFADFCDRTSQQIDPVQTGVFGANMQVSLTNDGPITFWLEV